MAAGIVVPVVAIAAGIVGVSAPAFAGQVSAVAASPSSATAGATATYTVTFTAAAGLTSGVDTITLTGPTGTAFSAATTDYQVIDNTTLASATASTVTTSGTSVTITAPIAVTGGDSVQVTANNATNPTHAGSYTLSVATSMDQTPTSSGSYSIVAASTSVFLVTAPATVTAGIAFTFTITAEDQYGNVDTGYTGFVSITSSDLGSGVILPSSYSFVAADNGTHTFTNGAKFVTARPQMITVTDGTVSGTSAGINVEPAAANTLVVSAPSLATAGTSTPVTVKAEDAYGNVDIYYSGNVHFTSTDVAAGLPADATLLGGSESFPVTFKTAGSQTVTASDTNTLTGTSNSVTVGPAAASTLSVTATTPVTAGSPATVTVTAHDQYGNTITDYTGTVHFTSTDTGTGVVLPADYTFAAGDNGTHAFAGGVTLVSAGSQTVSATDTVTSAITGTSGPVTVDPAAASSLSVTATPSVTAGSPATVTVTAQDAFGNTVTGYTGTVHFTSTDAGTGVVLPADYTFVAADNGTHAFTATLVTDGGQTITVTDTGIAAITGTSGTITVSTPSTSGGTTSGTVAAGGSFSSDPAGTMPTSSNPVVVSIRSPVAGSVSITKTTPSTAITGYRPLDIGAQITAPAATASAPLQVTFAVYVGGLPTGSYASDLTVFRDGVAVGSCPGAKAASPDPCVSASSISDDVETFTVLSSHASTWQLQAAQVGRVAGADRYATAVQASLSRFPNGNANAVVLASGDSYPDALVGTPLAAAKDAALLLTTGASLPTSTKTEIQRVLAAGKTVYVLGGTDAVPDSIATELAAMGYQVVRFGGADRYATAVKVADALGDPSTVLLVTGTNYPDGLVAGSAAAKLGGAVLLTNGSAMVSATSDYLAAHGKTVYAIGGPAARADAAATALAGGDRYGTAVKVAQTFFAGVSTIGFATGQNFPDALTGGGFVAAEAAPILLVENNAVPTGVANYLSTIKAGVATAHMFGGDVALTTALQGAIEADLGI